MQQARIQALKSQRDELAQKLSQMRETPVDQQPKKKSALAQWLVQMQEIEALISQIDEVIGRCTPAAPVAAAIQPFQPGAREDSTTVAVIPKGQRAELRVCVKPWEGRTVVDVRLWAALRGETEKRPSRKGVAFDASKLDAVIEALRQAKQFV